MSFPSYDSQSVNKQAVVKEIVSTNFPQDPLVSELQKAVNAARTAEARVRKVETDRTNRQEQWNQWELALKKSYTKQKQRRRTALEKLDKEQEAALMDLREARLQLRAVAGQQPETGHLAVRHGETEARAEQDFNAFLEAVDEDMDATDMSGHNAQDAVIRCAATSAQMPIPLPLRVKAEWS